MISFDVLDVCSHAVSPAVLSRHVAANSKILFAHRCRSDNDRWLAPEDHGSRYHAIDHNMAVWVADEQAAELLLPLPVDDMVHAVLARHTVMSWVERDLVCCSRTTPTWRPTLLPRLRHRCLLRRCRLGRAAAALLAGHRPCSVMA